MSEQILISPPTLHFLDLSKENIGEPISIGDHTDFKSYVEKLMEDFHNPARFKSYKFLSETSEIAQTIKGIAPSNWEAKTQIIANRLHRVEKDTQESISQLTNLRTGSLVQILTKKDDQTMLVFTKVDHNKFLDESDLKRKAGMPYNNRIQKSAVFVFEDSTTISSIRISDTNTNISKYWWKNFLELEEISSSEKNSKDSFIAIDTTLRRKLKSNNKNYDFWALRNAVISFYRTNNDFTFDTLVSNIFENYQPHDPSINMDEIKNEINQLPEKNGFDTQFTIDQSAIKARIKGQIELAKNLKLEISGEIENIENLIEAGISDDGRKYIRIFSEQGYKEFKVE